MATTLLTVVISFKWWVKPYLLGVEACSIITGMAPNLDRVAYWVMRGTKTKIVETPTGRKTP